MSYQDAPEYLLKAAQDSRQLVQDASNFMNSDVPEHVFGPPGVAGDPEAIEQHAHQINGLYEDILDWVAELRGASVPAEFSRAFELLAHLNDNAIFEYRRFVDDVVAHNDKLPAQIAAGRMESRTFTLRLTVPDEVVNAYSAELRRLQGIDTVGGWQEGGRIYRDPLVNRAIWQSCRLGTERSSWAGIPLADSRWMPAKGAPNGMKCNGRIWTMAKP